MSALDCREGAVCGVEWTRETGLGCKAVILATGGLSYPATGSTGDGYEFARALGHTIVEPRPSLVPLEVPGEDCPGCRGWP